MPAGSPPSSRETGSRDTGSQQALRRQNTERVLQSLARCGPTTQASLARITGLSTGTIFNIIRDLDRSKRIATRPVIASGRRAVEISLREESRLVLGLSFATDQVRLLLARVDHTVVAEATHPLPARHSPEVAMSLARGRLVEMLSEHGHELSEVAGAGISVPSPLRAGAVPVGPDAFPRWRDDDLARVAEQTLPFPCSIDNDANLGALAEMSWGPFAAVRNLAYLAVGEGIGAGLVIDGSVHRGAGGTAGEIGHLRVSDGGDHCYCGNRGCLETVASMDHIAHALRRTRGGQRTINAEVVVELARARDLSTLRVLEDAGIALGIALAALTNLINPEVVVIGGALAPVGAPLLDPLSRSLARHALPSVSAHTRLVMSQLPHGEVRGATSLAAQQLVFKS